MFKGILEKHVPQFSAGSSKPSYFLIAMSLFKITDGPTGHQELDMFMITKCYSKHYNITEMLVSPAHQGHTGAARERKYLILAHKEKLCQTFDPHDLYHKISKQICERISTQPHDYMVSSRLERLHDASQFAMKRKMAMKEVSW